MNKLYWPSQPHSGVFDTQGLTNAEAEACQRNANGRARGRYSALACQLVEFECPRLIAVVACAFSSQFADLGIIIGKGDFMLLILPVF